jgi:uncharacterized protein
VIPTVSSVDAALLAGMVAVADLNRPVTPFAPKDPLRHRGTFLSFRNVSHQPRGLMNASPLTATFGPLTGITDGHHLGVYDARTLTVNAVLLDVLPTTTAGLIALLRDLQDEEPEPRPLPVQLPVVTPTFQPLLGTAGGALSRLTINIANACNLWCSYCYADHGQYHAPNSLMKPDRAVAAVSRCLELYPRLRTVQFFGGEPLLHPDAIAAVADFLNTKLGGNAPAYVATTNGTVLSDRMADLLQRHHVGLTVSLDGPALAHDRLRPAKRGAPSHGTIMRNVERFRSMGIDVDFECTYTTTHYSLGITVADLLDYFWRELGEAEPHISWSYLPRPTSDATSQARDDGMFREDYESQARHYLPVELAVDLFRAGAQKSMTNLARGDGAILSFVSGILDHLTTRRPGSTYCPAFTSQLSIATSGDVYPCFMFIGDSRMRMGNIFEPSFPGREAEAVWSRHRDEFGSNATGTGAWYSALNSGCIAGEYIATSTLGERLYEPVYEAMIQEVILGIVREFSTTATAMEGAFYGQGAGWRA